MAGIRECPSLRIRVPVDCGRIRNPPVGSHRLTRPHGAHFACRVVTDSDNEVHLRRIGFGEFVPRFAPQAFGRHGEVGRYDTIIGGGRLRRGRVRH